MLLFIERKISQKSFQKDLAPKTVKGQKVTVKNGGKEGKTNSVQNIDSTHNLLVT